MPLAASSRNVYTYNPIQLSPHQIAQVLYQAGEHDLGDIAQMIPIAQRESGGRAGVQGTTMGYGAVSGDMGLFQINWGAHGEQLLRAGIIRTPQDLYDPLINAKAAVYLSGGGNPQAVRQLWGVANGTWAGSRGTLPPPNFSVVQQAQQSGLFNTPYNPGPGQGTPPYPAGTVAPPPGVSTAYYNMLYNGYNTQVGLNQALTQSQVDYARRQQSFANQLAGYQQQGLGLQREQLGLENKYQNDLALLNRNLTKKQQDLNIKEWRQIAANSKSQLDLQRKIRDATTKYLQGQKGFNQRDYQLAQQAINNVITTEAARWGEVQRVRGAETGLAKQKQQFIAKGAAETYAQALREAQFVESEQRREAKSDAITRGAMSSAGYGQDVASFATQRGLAGSAAQVQRDDVIRMSQNQLAGELENINQAYNQGRISYQDALRQANNARGRAGLNFQQRAADLGHQQQQAGLSYQGNVMDIGQQRSMAYLDFLGRGINLSAQQQQAARTQAYNNALYGINLAGLQNQGGSYAAQLAQQQAASQNQINQYNIGGLQNLAGINQQRSQTLWDQFNSLPSYAGAGGGSGTTRGGYATQRPRSAYSYDPSRTTRRSAGVYAPPASAYD